MEFATAQHIMPVIVALRKFGDRMTTPIKIFRSCIAVANKIESEPQTSRSVEMIEPLEELLEDIEDAVAALAPGDILFHHLSVLGCCCDSTAWVSAEVPMDVVKRAVQNADPSLEALRAMSDPSHEQLADSVQTFLTQLLQYVSTNYSVGLQFSDGSPAQVAEQSESTTPSNSDVSSGIASLSIAESHTADHLVAYQRDIVNGSLAAFSTAASNIGGIVQQQAQSVASTVSGIYDFVVTASKMPKPATEEEKQSMLGPIIASMTAVSNMATECPSRDPFFNHVKAVEGLVGFASWIIADAKPTSFITDAEASASFYLNIVLRNSKNTADESNQKAFVNSLRELCSSMKTYVKEYHTIGLRYGIGTEATQQKAGPSPVAGDDDTGEETNYVTAFKKLLDGPLAAYVSASEAIGGQVAEQAKPFAAAWKAEADFLSKAISTPKPADIQELLMPIGTQMGAVASSVESMDRRAPLINHCTAVAESVAALGWVAEEEKATQFVGDMAGAGQLFLNNVRMSAKRSDNPHIHRTWAASLETLYGDLKAYVKEYHTQKLVWNPPKSAPRKMAKVEEREEETSSDYVTAFKQLISGRLAAFVAASNALGGDVATLSTAFAGVWEAEAEFLSKAIAMPKPDDVQEMIMPIGAKMGEVGSIVEKVNPRSPFGQHCQAVGESVAALGWVVEEEKATQFVGDMAGAGQFFLNTVRMNAKKTENPEAHRTWAASLEALYADLKSYVKEYHTQKLVWNPPKAVRKTTLAETEDEETSSDYVTAFKQLISGRLAAFVAASNALGGDVATLSTAFVSVWEAEAEFLSKAIAMPKPDDVQEMIMPIGAKMGEVGSIVEKVNPRSPFGQHCQAVGESVAALGWVVEEEKATQFVGDMAGAGQFFLNTVRMNAKKTENPEAHRTWAASLEALYADLKSYVKNYHTQKLTWNVAK